MPVSPVARDEAQSGNALGLSEPTGRNVGKPMCSLANIELRNATHRFNGEASVSRDVGQEQPPEVPPGYQG